MNISNKRKRRYKNNFIKGGEGLLSQIEHQNKHTYTSNYTLEEFKDMLTLLEHKAYDYKE